MKELNSDSIVKACSKHLDCELLDESLGEQGVLLDMNAQKYFGLNEVALRIWQLAKKDTSFKNIIASIQSEFDVEADVCVADCSDFIREMNERGLVTIVDS